AVEEESGLRSIQVFDQQGTAVHKVFLTERSELAAWAPLLERFRADQQSAVLDLRPEPPPVIRKADPLIDAAALRADWAALQDTHHFFAMLKKHQVTRTQALRLAGRDWVEPLAPAELPRL